MHIGMARSVSDCVVLLRVCRGSNVHYPGRTSGPDGVTTELAATEFRPSYRRAAVMQASLAALGFVCSIAAWLAEHHWGWLLGGILLVAVIPFTLLAVRPINTQLLDPSLDRGSAHARQLLLRWDDCMRCVAY
jgi:Domain of unknown function (DUF1772)